jgi:hypothetical protein
MRVWGNVVLVLVLSLLVTLLGERVPAPRPADAPREVFSAARAVPTLLSLTELGVRVSGTPAARAAASRLVATLRDIPGVEVELQEAEGKRQFTDVPFPYPLFAYRTLNVVARLPGKSRDAVLLDAHYDTTGTSIGAGDDAFGVATLVEVLRALASDRERERSVIVLLNGGEEFGLRGADGFTKHPLFRDVRAYVYLDGMGAGRARLLHVTQGRGELLEAYARAVGRPSANSLMQDVVDRVPLGFDGDHRPFQDAGLGGLSLGCVDELASAHTSRDDLARVRLGSLQDMGDTTLALTRELVRSPEPPRGGPRGAHFDLFSVALVRYGRGASLVLAGLGLALAALALRGALRAGHVRVGELFSSLGFVSLASLAGLVASLALALALAFVLGRPHGWYTLPALAGLAFPFAALAAVLGVHALGRRRLAARQRASAQPWALWCATLALGALALAGMTAAGLGLSYLALVWVVSLALGLLAALSFPAHVATAATAALVPPVSLTSYLAVPALGALIPQVCATVLPIPADPIVAVLVTLPTLLVAAGAMIPLATAPRLGGAALVSLSIALVGALVLATRAPFSFERPRRVIAAHVEVDGRTGILLKAFDALPLEPDLAGVPGAAPMREDWKAMPAYYPEPSHLVPAPAPSFARPTLEVLSRRDEGAGERSVTVRLVATTIDLHVLVPVDRLVAWSLGSPLPATPAAGARHMVQYSGMRPEGEVLTLRLRGEAPVPIELRASDPVASPELEALLKQLPSHVVFWPEAARVVKTEL